MQISRKLVDGTVTYSISGKFVHTYYQKFRSIIDEIKQNNLKEAILDLSGVTQVDSLALGMILLAKDEATKLGIKISVSNPTPDINSCLKSANFDKYIEVRA